MGPHRTDDSRLEDTIVAERERREDVLWKQYEMLVELHKFYLGISLCVTLFFYLSTGGILAFYFSHTTEPLVRYSLLLPIVLSTALGGVFLYGASSVGYIRKELLRIRDDLELEVAPDVQVLAGLLRFFGLIFLVVAASMAVLVFAHASLSKQHSGPVPVSARLGAGQSHPVSWGGRTSSRYRDVPMASRLHR